MAEFVPSLDLVLLLGTNFTIFGGFATSLEFGVCVSVTLAEDDEGGMLVPTLVSVSATAEISDSSRFGAEVFIESATITAVYLSTGETSVKVKVVVLARGSKVLVICAPVVKFFISTRYTWLAR